MVNLDKQIINELKEIKRALIKASCQSAEITPTEPCCAETNDLLQDVITAIDNLSIDLNIDTDNINVNLTDVEVLLTSINTLLSQLNALVTNIDLNILTLVNQLVNIITPILTNIDVNLVNIDTTLTNLLSQINLILVDLLKNEHTWEEEWCDTFLAPLGNVEVIQKFTKVYYRVDGVVTSENYLDGVLYTPQGTVSKCEDCCKDTYANDTFQIKDCTGTDIGSPQEVKKTIVLNNITTSICNFQELADAIISGFPTNPPIVNYNNEEELIITPNTTYNITANSVHAYSLNVKGTGTQSTISINGAIPLPISNGYSKQIEFSTTNSFSIDIFCDTNDTIRLIKQF